MVMLNQTSSSANMITTTDTTINIAGASGFSVQAVVDVNTPSAVTFAADTDVAIATDTITKAAHGLTTGLKGQASSTATLPGGLAVTTDYFVIASTAGTFKLASSLANALAGTAIDLTTNGTAASTHTFTPTALAGATVLFSKSNDNTNFTDLDAATAITADGVVWCEKVDPNYKYLRIRYTLTAGRMSTSNYILAKGTPERRPE